MDEIMKFLISQKPFGYISKNKKKVLNDFLACELLNESYAYQYLNSSFYKELILLICLIITYKNISNGKKIDLDALAVDTKILYQKDYYLFKGQDESTPGNYKLVPVYKRKDSFNRSLKKIDIENGATVVNSTKRRKVSNAKEDFGKLLGLPSISMTIEESVIVLVEKKVLDKILEVQFNINGKTVYLGDFCTMLYLKDSLNFEQLSHSNSAEKPSVIFASKIYPVVEYLDENEGKVPEEKVYVIGDRWFTNGQLINLNTLKDACDDFGILMTVFSSVSSVMDESKIEFLKKMDENFCWLEPEDSNEIEISFNFVSSNKDLYNAIKKLSEYLEEIREVLDLRYLDRLLKRFLKMSYSQLVGCSVTLEKQMIMISEYMEKLKLKETEEISNVLYEIYCNRFGYQNKKVIESIRGKNKCAIIVMDEMVEEAKEIYRNNDEVVILPYNEPIYENLYGSFDTIILLSPYSKDRKKWLSSYLASRIIVVLPKLQKKYLTYSLKKDKKEINMLYTLDTSSSKLDSAYLKAINNYLENVKQEQKPLQRDSKIEDNRLFDALDQEEDVQKIYSSFIDKLVQTGFEAGDENEKQLVNITRGVDLESGGIIFGTEFGKVFILQNNFCRKTDVDNLKIGQEIVEFDIPYSDSFYRQELKKYYHHGQQDLDVDESAYLDFFWKDILFNYIEKGKVTPTQFKTSMDKLGATEKSISFYRLWSSIDSVPIHPRDSDFIYYIGILTGNAELTNEPNKYYNASVQVRRNLSDQRESFIDSINGKELNEIIKDDSIKNYSKDVVVLVENLDMEDVPRYLTNKILRGQN